MTTTATVQRYGAEDFMIHVHALDGSGYDRFTETTEDAARELVSQLHADGVIVQCWCGAAADHWEDGSSSDGLGGGPRCGSHALDAEPLDAADLNPDRVEDAVRSTGAEAHDLIDALDGAELRREAQRFADALAVELGLRAPVTIRVERLRPSASGTLVRGEYRTRSLDRLGRHVIGLNPRTPRGVRPYVLAHELVHATQAERAAAQGSTFAAYVAPQMALPYLERPFEAEARALGLVLAGSMISSDDPFRGVRATFAHDRGAGLDALDVERAAQVLERAELGRVAEATDDPADAQVPGPDTVPLDRVEDAERPATAPVWCTRLRADVTWSLPRPEDAEATLPVALGVADRSGSGGATLAGPLIGSWRGCRETAYRLELIGADALDRAYAVADALVAETTCEAIQVETWSDDAYRAREVRAREPERVEDAERAQLAGPDRRAAQLRDAAQLAEDGLAATACAIASAARDDYRAAVPPGADARAAGGTAPERVAETAVAGRVAPLGARSGRVLAPELERLDAAAQRALAALDRRPTRAQLARLERTTAAALAARLAGASAETIAAGRGWYPAAERAVRSIAERHGLSSGAVAAAVAALSPRKHWADNLRAADRLAAAVATGAEPPSVHFGRQQAAALGALRGELEPDAAATGPKVGPFRRAISGDPSALVLDTWAVRAAGLPETALQRRPVRTALERAYADAAAAAGLAVRDAQAVAWLAVRGVVPSDPEDFRVAERVEDATNLPPGVEPSDPHFYPADDPPEALICEDREGCGYVIDADALRYVEEPSCPRCGCPLEPGDDPRMDWAPARVAETASYRGGRRAIVPTVSYRRRAIPPRAIRIDRHAHGPRVYVLDRRVHHGPPAIAAAAVLIGAGRYRAASVALLWALEDARDFPWTDGRNHAPRRRAIRPARLLTSLILTTLTARSDR